MSEADVDNADLSRYQRQIVCDALGVSGQHALAGGRVLVIGLGGLGSRSAEMLTRAGVGFLRLVDDDRVDLTNLHRQALYDETDAREHLPKAQAAAVRLREINSQANIEPIVSRVDHTNIETLAEHIDVIVDGTDNFASRYLINDLCVKTARPWVFAGVVATEAQTMTIVPGRTPCLRCVLDSPPPPCSDPNCRNVGVLGPAVAAVAAFQAGEVIKLLTGQVDRVSPYLLKFDLWSNELQRIDLRDHPASQDCPCCGEGHYEFLQPASA